MAEALQFKGEQTRVPRFLALGLSAAKMYLTLMFDVAAAFGIFCWLQVMDFDSYPGFFL
jgi:hypothetical protein